MVSRTKSRIRTSGPGNHVAGNIHPGPALRQGQWNVVKLGNTAHEGQCKRQRFKNIHIEAIDPTGGSPSSTIPIMTDEIINQEMDTMVDYTNSILNSFRTNIFDAVMIYGFGVGKASTGIVKAKVKILDGLSEWANWTPCSKSCGSGKWLLRSVLRPGNASVFLCETMIQEFKPEPELVSMIWPLFSQLVEN